jgi:ABC-type spermidine/putrescine transport system permease subunit II
VSSKLAKTVGSVCVATLLVAGGVTALANVFWLFSGQWSTAHVVMAFVGIAAVVLILRTVDVRRILGGFSFLVYLVLFAPILVVMIYAFNAGEIITVWSGFSTKWFGEALRDSQIRVAIAESFKIAFCSSLLSVVFASAAALVISRARFSLRLPYEAMLFLTLVVPELVLAIGLLLFYMRFGIPFGMQTVMVGHAVFGSSVALLIVRARYTGTGLDLERASADLGAGPWATLRQVTLPRLAPAIAAAFLLTFIMSFDNVVISQFTAGGTQTWPLYLLSALRFGVSPEVNAVSVLLLVAVLLIAALTALVMRSLSRMSAPPTPALVK